MLYKQILAEQKPLPQVRLRKIISFIPPSKNMHVRLIGDSKLTLGVSVSGCFSAWPCDGLVTSPGGTPPLAQ